MSHSLCDLFGPNRRDAVFSNASLLLCTVSKISTFLVIDELDCQCRIQTHILCLSGYTRGFRFLYHRSTTSEVESFGKQGDRGKIKY